MTSVLAQLLGALPPLIGAIAGLATAVAGSEQGRLRSLKTQVEILQALPQNSASATKLSRLIDNRVDELVTYETKARRQVGIAVMAGVTVIACTLASWWAIDQGGWWLLVLTVTLPLGVVCGYGVTESLAKVPRDEKGNRATDE